MMDLAALCMTSIMIYHVKTKYTAVGRKEIAMFFQLYLVTIFLEMLLVTNIIPTASILYPVNFLICLFSITLMIFTSFSQRHT